MSVGKLTVANLICGVVVTFSSVPDAWATIVNIDGAVSGYYPVADPVAGFTDPVQITLPAGIYAVSDAFGRAGATYGAYNEHLTSSDDWFWHYVVGTAAGRVFLNVGSPSAYETDIAAVTGGLAQPPATLILFHTTTLDFAVYDNYVTDNSGGISLDITPLRIPEPASISVFGLGLGLLGWTLIKRSRPRQATRS